MLKRTLPSEKTSSGSDVWSGISFSQSIATSWSTSWGFSGSKKSTQSWIVISETKNSKSPQENLDIMSKSIVQIPNVSISIDFPAKSVYTNESFQIVATIKQISAETKNLYTNITNLPIDGLTYFQIISQNASEATIQKNGMYTRTTTIKYTLKIENIGTYDIWGNTIRFWKKKLILEGKTISVVKGTTKTTSSIQPTGNNSQEWFLLFQPQYIVWQVRIFYYLLILIVLVSSIFLWVRYILAYLKKNKKKEAYVPKTLQEYEWYIRFILWKRINKDLSSITFNEIIQHEVVNKKVLSDILHALISEKYKQRNFWALTTVSPELITLLHLYETGFDTILKN